MSIKKTIVCKLRYFLSFLDDKKYLSLNYLIKTNKRLNWNDPKTFNEKINWLKLNVHNNEYVKLVDKIEVKEYVASIIGYNHIIKTLKVWNNIEDIDITKLPECFVIKTSHDSGGVIICSDKKNFDFAKAKRILKKSLK